MATWQINVSIDPIEKEKLQEKIQNQCISVSKLVKKLLIEYFEELEGGI